MNRMYGLGCLLVALVVGEQANANTNANECDKGASKDEIKACHAKRLETKPLFSANLIPYKPNYFMLLSHNTKRGEQSSDSLPEGVVADNTEGKFQISFKHPIYTDFFDTGIDMWFAYSQQSYWQLYNTDNSSPFRESNYEPEAWFEKRFLHLNYQGWRFDKLALGINHQSNGRGDELSRSWNRIIVSASLHREWSKDRVLSVEMRAWRRLEESLEEDDNPDLIDFMGHGEVIVAYKHQKHQVSFQVRNLFSGDSKQGISVDYSYPLPWSKALRAYVQFTGGYGESLIDYDQQNNTLSVGVALAHWLP